MWWSFLQLLLSAGLIFPVCAWINSELCLIYQLLLFTSQQIETCVGKSCTTDSSKRHLRLLDDPTDIMSFKGFYFCKHSCVVACTTPQWLYPFIKLRKKKMKWNFVDAVVELAILRNSGKGQTWPGRCCKFCMFYYSSNLILANYRYSRIDIFEIIKKFVFFSLFLIMTHFFRKDNSVPPFFSGHRIK